MTMLRAARETDLPAIAEMIVDFVKGHKAEHHPRSPENLRAAYFADHPVAHLLVAERHERVIGMIQWSRFYDQFWSMFGVRGEWLYVRPDARGLGIAAVLVAEICELGRREGAVFLQAGAISDDIARLYARVAIGGPSFEYFVSGEAFHVFADLAGKPVRDIVRGLPTPEVSRVPPGTR